jgi:histidinol-phosphate aminotransferase
MRQDVLEQFPRDQGGMQALRIKSRDLQNNAGLYAAPKREEATISLHLNENLFHEAALANIHCSGESNLHREILGSYPDNLLADSVSARFSIPRTSVTTAPGSSAALRAIFSYLLGAGDVVLLPSPSWSFYAATAALVHARVSQYKLAEAATGYSYDLNAIERAINSHGPRVVLICSPNNPTGNSISSPALGDLVRRHPQVDFIVDQAYYGFIESRDADSLLDLACRVSNLYVIRTFSKFYALANLRLGYVICNKDCSKQLAGMLDPFGLPTFSQHIASGRLKDVAFASAIKGAFLDARDYLIAHFRHVPSVRVYDTDANFMLFRFSPAWPDVPRLLQSKGFLVKRESIDPAFQFVRLTIADTITLRQVVSILSSVEPVHHES